MLIRNDSEYVLGSEWETSVRKLTGRREDYNPFQELGFSFLFAGPGIILYAVATLLHQFNWWLLIGVVLLVFGWGLSKPLAWGKPARRRYYFDKCVEENRVLTSDDVLFQMLMTPEVKLAVRNPAESWYAADCEWKIDQFIKSVAPYRNRKLPEQSEFLTAEWEARHGKVHEDSYLREISACTGYSVDLRKHVRGVVTGLRQKRLAQLQRSQLELQKAHERDRTELHYLQSAILQQR